MIYIKQGITELTLSNVPSTHTVYDSSYTYSIGEEVRVGSYIYKSVTDGNIGNNPIETSGIYWYDGKVPSNEYALIDLNQDTQTVWDENGIVEFNRGISDYIAIGNFSARVVTISYLDSSDNVLALDEYNFSANGNVYELWSYIYGGFTESTSKTIYAPIRRTGIKVRVEFDNNGAQSKCGYLVVGKGYSMGTTLNTVSFPDTKIGSNYISVANFDTITPKNELIRKMDEAKSLIGESLLFVIDESESSSHENMIIIGSITKCDGVAENNNKNKIAWEITQANNY